MKQYVLLLVLTACSLVTCADHAVKLSILVNAAPPPAHSHAFAMRRVAHALAAAGHTVTLLESSSASAVQAASPLDSNRLTVLRAELMSDAIFHARFDAGESFQRLMQEVNLRWVPQVMTELEGMRFDLAVVDAVHPLFAKRFGLPSIHVQCSSDDDAIEALWFYYGLTAGRTLSDISRRIQFAALVATSWLMVGTHEDEPGVAIKTGPSWGEYYRDYVISLLMQGTSHFTLPIMAAQLASVHHSRVMLVGSLTSRRGSNSTPEVSQLDTPISALVAFGTKSHKCPLEILDALTEIGLVAAVLVNACSDEKITPHIAPASRDQAAWLVGQDMRLAVVHGGIHSLYEAVSIGLPIACVPHEGDQWANCRDIQRQSLGWALRPKASKQEAVAVFRMLLKRGHASRSVIQSFTDAGGPASVVRHVDKLAPLLRGWNASAGPVWRGTSMVPLHPFFYTPFSWPEGWCMIFLVAVPALPVLVYLKRSLSGT